MKCWKEKHRGTEDTEKSAVASSVISVPLCFTSSPDETNPIGTVLGLNRKLAVPASEAFTSFSDKRSTLLCRELTTKSLAELSRAFGLGHPDSSANLIKRARKLTSESQKVNKTHKQLKSEILNTENQV